MSRYEGLLAAAPDLPETKRADLAARLIESLDGAADADVDAAWAAEIERRCTALESGQAVSSDWSESASGSSARLRPVKSLRLAGEAQAELRDAVAWYEHERSVSARKASG